MNHREQFRVLRRELNKATRRALRHTRHHTGLLGDGPGLAWKGLHLVGKAAEAVLGDRAMWEVWSDEDTGEDVVLVFFDQWGEQLVDATVENGQLQWWEFNPGYSKEIDTDLAVWALVDGTVGPIYCRCCEP